MKVRFRNYRESDYEATTELMRQLSEEAYKVKFDEEKWRKASRLRYFSPDSRGQTIIAEDDENGEVIGMGFITAKLESTGLYVGYLNDFIIRKDYIGHGIGMDMAFKAIDILENWKVNRIRINILMEVKEYMLKLVEKVGFRPTYIVAEKIYQ
ncbi:MAG: GNAT family N-acetyltransferase [Candidatus Helarchaeota archaeon]|nr:GNAT family N-acetyltransferase [Candidatus Helarchaeota archaeon]